MTASQLLSDMARFGIQLRADGDRLAFWPKSAVTPSIEARLRNHKHELLVILTDNSGIDPSDANSVWQAAMDDLERDPDFPNNLIATLRNVQASWVGNRDNQESKSSRE